MTIELIITLLNIWIVQSIRITVSDEEYWRINYQVSLYQNLFLGVVTLLAALMYASLGFRHARSTFKERGFAVLFMTVSLLASNLIIVVLDHGTAYRNDFVITHEPWLRFLCVQVPVLIFAYLTPKDDWIAAYNRYPCQFPKISYI